MGFGVTIDPRPGLARAGLRLAAAIVAACVVGAVTCGCPRLPPAVGCTPMTYRCTDDGRPQVCSASQRWQPIGDSPCAASGAICVVGRTAHCAPMTITAGETQ